MQKKLQHRFVLVAMTAFGLVMIILIAAINLMNYRQTLTAQDETTQQILEYDQMSSSVEDSEALPPITEMPWAVNNGSEFTTRFFLVHCDKDGNVNVFGDGYISSVDKTMAEQYTKAVLDRRKEKGNYGDYRYLISEGENEMVIVFLNVADTYHFQKTLLFSSVLIGVLSLIAVFLLVLIFAGQAVKPYVRNAELQKRFITDAGHELKTPITSIATSADILAMDYEENEWVSNIQKQSERLIRLVNDLVMLSRLDEEVPFPEKKTFSLSETAWKMTESFAAQAKIRGRLYEQQIEDGVMMHGDPESIKKLLSILLDNAIKYSDFGGKIRLSVYHSRNHAVIEVFNTGDMSGLTEPERLFDRFYRPDESRSSKTGGSGIGLSIAQSVVENHGGRISVGLPDEKSILFKVVL